MGLISSGNSSEKMLNSCCKQIYNKKQKFNPVRTSLAHQIRYNKTLVAYFLPAMSGFST